MANLLLGALKWLPGPMLELGARFGIWLLKRSGAKEDEIRLFEAEVRIEQESRAEATRAAQAEDEMARRMDEKLKAEREAASRE